MRRFTLDALALAIALVTLVDSDPVSAAATLPLLARRRLPFAGPAIVFAVFAAVALVRPAALIGGSEFAFFSLLLAFWVAGAQRERRDAVAATALGVATLAVIAPSAGLPTEVDTGSLGLGIVIFALLGAGLSAGAFALRAREERAAELEQRGERLERDRDQRSRAAVAQERARIARDLHDVIAHSVSVMTLQSGAARLLLDQDPRSAREPLLVVEQTGRQALAEMRRLLVDDEPATPGLADLPKLAEQVRAAGLPVQVAVDGDARPLSPGLEMTAYRIVQEALTNALKHAGRATARVSVRYDADALRLEVADDGSAHGGGAGGGHGLIGMRERVALYDGQLRAGPGPAGFTVTARLPL